MVRLSLVLLSLGAGLAISALAEPARVARNSGTSLQLAQQPNVEVRQLEEKNPGESPFKIRQNTQKKAVESAQNSPSAQPSTTEAAPLPEPKPAQPAQPANQANAAVSDVANKVRRPTQSGESSGNAVAAFWFVLP